MNNKNIIAALLKAQSEMKAPEKKGKNPRFKSDYAKLDDIYAACQKVLNSNGLFVTHTVEENESRSSCLITTIYHTSGESFSSRFPMILENQTNQSIASARTYACRYSLCNLLAINFDKDDDGEESEGIYSDSGGYKNSYSSDNKKTVSPKQAAFLASKLSKMPALHESILRHYKINHINELPREHAEYVFQSVNNCDNQNEVIA